ncbi:hypothetical protein PR202_ga03099 [Eleusine coracana subsp. coracana]|uniref:Uncharacterized protein n=1 Tax=Eleusine coracana subsp. coracana TaxID=191504 RepID=A0AAV5BLS9_ELECO|nr:hypothetical protein PR202_ga03099 [Eleusine coracana subsp. coracana]
MPSLGRAAKQAVSLREESSGRTHVDEATLLRVQHLQRLAAWAGAEAGVGPVGALLGRRLAASAEASGAAILQVNLSARLTELTSERAEQSERLELNLPTDCKMEDGATLSSVESGHLAFSTVEEGSVQKVELENGNEHTHETEPVSSRDTSKRIETSEANDTLEAGLMVGSKFVTPQKNKLMDLAEPFSTKSTRNKKGEASQSVASKTLSSCSKSVPNDSRKHSKSATSDATQVSGSSRKRARKGWTTLRQIAEKDEMERKEKMGNFVIPFFMQRQRDRKSPVLLAGSSVAVGPVDIRDSENGRIRRR